MPLPLCIHPEVPQAGIERRSCSTAARHDSRDLRAERDRNTEGACEAGARAFVAERAATTVAEPRDAVDKGQDVESIDAGVSGDPEGVLGSAPLGKRVLRGDDGKRDG